MADITVTFDAEPGADSTIHPDVPVSVDVGEYLYEDAGNDFDDTSGEQVDYGEFCHTVEPATAIEAALTIIASAPAFDGISAPEIDAPGVVAHVEYTDLKNASRN